MAIFCGVVVTCSVLNDREPCRGVGIRGPEACMGRQETRLPGLSFSTNRRSESCPRWKGDADLRACQVCQPLNLVPPTNRLNELGWLHSASTASPRASQPSSTFLHEQRLCGVRRVHHAPCTMLPLADGKPSRWTRVNGNWRSVWLGRRNDVTVVSRYPGHGIYLRSI